MFGCDYRENTIAITGGAVQNIQHDTGLPKGELERIRFITTGANNGLAGTGWDSYVFTLNSDEWLNMLPTELRCLLEYIYSRYGGVIPADTDLSWTLPLDLFSMLLPAEGGVMPQVGLPARTKKVFLRRGNANLSAGLDEIGWKAPNRRVDYVPHLVGQTVNGLAASSNEQQFDLKFPQHKTAGLILDLGATEFTRIRFFLADENGKTREVSDWKRDDILLNLQPYSAQALTDPIFIPFDYPIVIPQESYLLVNTGAGYNGTQRIVPVQFIPATKAQATAASSAQ